MVIVDVSECLCCYKCEKLLFDSVHLKTHITYIQGKSPFHFSIFHLLKVQGFLSSWSGFYPECMSWVFSNGPNQMSNNSFSTEIFFFELNAWVNCTFYNCFDHLCIFTLLHIHFTITITLCRRLRMRSTTTNVLSALWIMYLPIRFVILLSINRVKIVQCFGYHCTDLRAMGHCNPNRITDLCLSFYLHPNISHM